MTMIQNHVYFDRLHGSRLQLLEIRRHIGLFQDLDAKMPTMVSCNLDTVSIIPTMRPPAAEPRMVSIVRKMTNVSRNRDRL